MATDIPHTSTPPPTRTHTCLPRSTTTQHSTRRNATPAQARCSNCWWGHPGARRCRMQEGPPPSRWLRHTGRAGAPPRNGFSERGIPGPSAQHTPDSIERGAGGAARCAQEWSNGPRRTARGRAMPTRGRARTRATPEGVRRPNCPATCKKRGRSRLASVRATCTSGFSNR